MIAIPQVDVPRYPRHLWRSRAAHGSRKGRFQKHTVLRVLTCHGAGSQISVFLMPQIAKKIDAE